MLVDHLPLIRKRAGLSQGQLAAQIGVDASLVSRWEKGERAPSLDQQTIIARTLGVTLDYLLHGKLRVEFKFRAHSTLSADEKKTVRQVLTDAEQQLHFIDEAYRLAEKKPRPFLLSVDPVGQHWTEAAERIRTLLRLNQCVTFEELKQALVECGVHVFGWHAPHRISGLSYRGTFAAIFINDDQSEARRLFTLAHEAVHVLCHLHPSRTNDGGETTVSIGSNRDPMEKEANRLAAELLMPEALVKTMADEYGHRLRSPLALDAMSRHFNVSRDAMFYRLVGLGKFDWSDRTRFFEAFQQPVWTPRSRVTEIERQVPPNFLNLVLSLYDEERISAGKLAEWLACPRSAVDSLLDESERRDQFDLAVEEVF